LFYLAVRRTGAFRYKKALVQAGASKERKTIWITNPSRL